MTLGTLYCVPWKTSIWASSHTCWSQTAWVNVWYVFTAYCPCDFGKGFLSVYLNFHTCKIKHQWVELLGQYTQYRVITLKVSLLSSFYFSAFQLLHWVVPRWSLSQEFLTLFFKIVPPLTKYSLPGLTVISYTYSHLIHYVFNLHTCLLSASPH